MMSPIDMLGIAQVHRFQRSSQRGGAAGNDHQVNVVAHQAIRQNLQTMLVGIVLQEFQITPPVIIGEEYVLPPITALRNMMRNTGQYRSGHPWHV
jgi:hypothetical protein